MGLSMDQGVNMSMTQNVIENSSLSKQLVDKEREKLDFRGTDNIAAKVAEKDGEKGLGADLISGFLKKVSANYVEKNSKNLLRSMTDDLQREADQLFTHQESSEDGVELSRNKSESLDDNKLLKNLKNTILAKNNFFSNLSIKQKELMAEYVASYQASQEVGPMQRTQSKEYKQMLVLEEQLRQVGMEEDNVRDFKAEVKECVGFQGAEKQQKINTLYDRGKKFFSGTMTREQRELLSEFVDLFPRYLMEDQKGQHFQQIKQKVQERMEELEDKLEQSGISRDEIAQAKIAVQNELTTTENDKENKKKEKFPFKSNKFFEKKLTLKQQSLVREFIEYYPRAMHAQSNVFSTNAKVLQQRIAELERQLQQEGMTTNQLQDLKMQIRYSIRGSMVKQLAEAKVERILFERTGEGIAKVPFLLAQRKENTTRDTIYRNEKLGGQDFGNYRSAVAGVEEHITSKAYEEVRTYGMDEIINCLVRARLDPDKVDEEMKNIQQLAYLVARSKGDMSEMNKMMSTMIDDLGFVDFRIQDYDILSGGPGDQQQKQKQPDYGEYAYGEDDEKEILINRYKALVMRRAIFPDARTYLETSFKLRRTKQGMVQLGIFSPKLEEELTEAAKKLAVEKLLEMLKEALIERASFYEMAGTAYTLNEKKIKSILKNMMNLGCPLEQEEFIRLRDQANKRIFDVTNRELQMVNLAYKNNPQPFFARKRSQLIRLLTRLKAESAIAIEISYEVDAFNAMSPNNTKNQGLGEYIWDDINIKLSDAKFYYGATDIFSHVIDVVIDTLENIDHIKMEVLEQDLAKARQFLADMQAKQEEKDHKLIAWANELRVMLLFAKKNTKGMNVEVVDSLVQLLVAMAK